LPAICLSVSKPVASTVILTCDGRHISRAMCE
jgi:hypothetical protein